MFWFLIVADKPLKTQWLKVFLSILQSDGARHLADVAYWCRLLMSLLLVGRLAETLGGWAPLCTHGPWVSFSTYLRVAPAAPKSVK